ncbi:MAG: hypothetical protein R3D71_09100 [Rickettsiales bacterium]
MNLNYGQMFLLNSKKIGAVFLLLLLSGCYCAVGDWDNSRNASEYLGYCWDEFSEDYEDDG